MEENEADEQQPQQQQQSGEDVYARLRNERVQPHNKAVFNWMLHEFAGIASEHFKRFHTDNDLDDVVLLEETSAGKFSFETVIRAGHTQHLRFMCPDSCEQLRIRMALPHHGDVDMYLSHKHTRPNAKAFMWKNTLKSGLKDILIKSKQSTFKRGVQYYISLECLTKAAKVVLKITALTADDAFDDVDYLDGDRHLKSTIQDRLEARMKTLKRNAHDFRSFMFNVESILRTRKASSKKARVQRYNNQNNNNNNSESVLDFLALNKRPSKLTLHSSVRHKVRHPVPPPSSSSSSSSSSAAAVAAAAVTGKKNPFAGILSGNTQQQPQSPQQQPPALSRPMSKARKLFRRATTRLTILNQLQKRQAPLFDTTTLFLSAPAVKHEQQLLSREQWSDALHKYIELAEKALKSGLTQSDLFTPTQSPRGFVQYPDSSYKRKTGHALLTRTQDKYWLSGPKFTVRNVRGYRASDGVRSVLDRSPAAGINTDRYVDKPSLHARSIQSIAPVSTPAQRQALSRRARMNAASSSSSRKPQRPKQQKKKAVREDVPALNLSSVNPFPAATNLQQQQQQQQQERKEEEEEEELLLTAQHFDDFLETVLGMKGPVKPELPSFSFSSSSSTTTTTTTSSTVRNLAVMDANGAVRNASALHEKRRSKLGIMIPSDYDDANLFNVSAQRQQHQRTLQHRRRSRSFSVAHEEMLRNERERHRFDIHTNISENLVWVALVNQHPLAANLEDFLYNYAPGGGYRAPSSGSRSSKQEEQGNVLSHMISILEKLCVLIDIGSVRIEALKQELEHLRLQIIADARTHHPFSFVFTPMNASNRRWLREEAAIFTELRLLQREKFQLACDVDCLKAVVGFLTSMLQQYYQQQQQQQSNADSTTTTTTTNHKKPQYWQTAHKKPLETILTPRQQQKELPLFRHPTRPASTSTDNNDDDREESRAIDRKEQIAIEKTKLRKAQRRQARQAQLESLKALQSTERTLLAALKTADDTAHSSSPSSSGTNNTNTERDIARRVRLASRKARYQQVVAEMNSEHADVVAQKLLVRVEEQAGSRKRKPVRLNAKYSSRGNRLEATLDVPVLNA